MLHSQLLTLAQVCHTIGFVIVLYGALVLVVTLLNQFQPLAFLKGLGLIIIGAWFSGLAG